MVGGRGQRVSEPIKGGALAFIAWVASLSSATVGSSNAERAQIARAGASDLAGPNPAVVLDPPHSQLLARPRK